MTACSADGNCQGIYDNGCDVGANDIFLCPTSATYRNSSRSCIYQRNENGKYLKYFYIDAYSWKKYRNDLFNDVAISIQLSITRLRRIKIHMSLQ